MQSEWMYYIFLGNFSIRRTLSAAPQIFAETINKYGMYSAFAKTNITSIKLPFTDISKGWCLKDAFMDCTYLSSVEVNWTTWPKNDKQTDRWLNGVAATGEFICPAALVPNIPSRDGNGVPSGWTIITK